VEQFLIVIGYLLLGRDSLVIFCWLFVVGYLFFD